MKGRRKVWGVNRMTQIIIYQAKVDTVFVNLNPEERDP